MYGVSKRCETEGCRRWSVVGTNLCSACSREQPTADKEAATEARAIEAVVSSDQEDESYSSDDTGTYGDEEIESVLVSAQTIALAHQTPSPPKTQRPIKFLEMEEQCQTKLD